MQSDISPWLLGRAVQRQIGLSTNGSEFSVLEVIKKILGTLVQQGEDLRVHNSPATSALCLAPLCEFLFFPLSLDHTFISVFIHSVNISILVIQNGI